MPLIGGAVTTDPVVTGAPSATTTLKRTISDVIRNLWAGSSVMFALVAKGEAKAGSVMESRGMISKKSTDHPRFETFTYTPLAIQGTVTAFSGTTLETAAISTLRPYYTIVNTTNNTVARVDSVTSTTEYEVTSVGGTAFDASAGDVFLIMAPAYPENSSSPSRIWKDEDNVYNLTQNVRYPVAISGSSKGNTHYAIEDYFKRMKAVSTIEGNRKTEGMFLFSERASSGNDTSGGSALTGSFRTTRGVWNWAANSYDAGGMTWDKFQSDVPMALGNTVNFSQRFVMVTSQLNFAVMNGWINDKLTVEQTSDLKKFGLKGKKFETSGPEIDVVVHEQFNIGGNQNKALIFVPDQLFYCYKKGRDLQPRMKIQTNSTDGLEDEIFGELGPGSFDGGNSILTITGFRA
ncbi:unnamed protein product [marine sediment metagenome]|uniref:Uncharacterized protein n=1 Tax=marine sediment metagenome TaxID=412755 RepID=X0S445_9ZZZZ